MNNKLKRINLDNIKSKLKDHVQISDGMKKKLEDAKQYYIDLGHDFVTHGSIPELHEYYGLSAEKIAEFVREVHQNEN